VLKIRMYRLVPKVIYMKMILSFYLLQWVEMQDSVLTASSWNFGPCTFLIRKIRIFFKGTMLGDKNFDKGSGLESHTVF
jgi:hypothetical protein